MDIQMWCFQKFQGDCIFPCTVQYFSVYRLETNATVTDALLLSPAVASAHDTALWHGRINHSPKYLVKVWIWTPKDEQGWFLLLMEEILLTSWYGKFPLLTGFDTSQGIVWDFWTINSRKCEALWGVLKFSPILFGMTFSNFPRFFVCFSKSQFFSRMPVQSITNGLWNITMEKKQQPKTRLVVSNMFYFHPYLGKVSNLTNIFQRGWNHQPEKWWLSKWEPVFILLGGGGRAWRQGSCRWWCWCCNTNPHILRPFGIC